MSVATWGGGVARFEKSSRRSSTAFLRHFRLDLSRQASNMREVCRRLDEMGCHAAGRCSMVCVRPSTACSTIQPISVARSLAGFTTARLVPGRGRSEGILSAFAASQPTHPGASRRNGSTPPFRLWSTAMLPGRSRATRRKPQGSVDRKIRSGWLLQGLAVCCGCGYAYCGKASPRLREGAFEETALLSYAVAPRDIDLAARRRAPIDRCAPTSSKRLSGAR